MEPTQPPKSKSHSTGHWVFVGTALGAFAGLLQGKFALGLIFGFFIGIVISSVKRKASADHETP